MLQSASNKPLQPSINVKPEETLVEIMLPTIKSLVTAAASSVAQRTDLRQKQQLLALIKVLIKGIISRSPDSCIFPLIENISIYSLEVSSFSFVNHNIQTLSCRGTAWEIPSTTWSCRRGLTGKAESGLTGLPGSIPPMARPCGET